MRSPTKITQTQVKTLCKGGFNGGAKLVEIMLPDGTKIAMHADDPVKVNCSDEPEHLEILI